MPSISAVRFLLPPVNASVLGEQLVLDRFQRDSGLDENAILRRSTRCAKFLRHVTDRQRRRTRHNDVTFNHVLQFANIARPGVSLLSLPRTQTRTYR